MKEACIEKIQGVVASFQSVCSSRKLKLMSSDVKLLPMKSFEITRIQRGLLILLLLLERDYRYYAFYITAIIYHVFGIQYSEDRSPKQLRWRTFRQNYWPFYFFWNVTTYGIWYILEYGNRYDETWLIGRSEAKWRRSPVERVEHRLDMYCISIGILALKTGRHCFQLDLWLHGRCQVIITTFTPVHGGRG